MSKSELETALLLKIADAHLPEPWREFRFNSNRNWRFDFCWPQYHVAAEVHGGTHIRGAHNRHKGIKNDAEKANAAQREGWLLLTFVRDHIDGNYAIERSRRC